MTAITRRRSAWVALAAAAALLSAGALTGCNGETGGGGSSSSGAKALTDTTYWEGVFAKGWSNQVEGVVAKGAAAVPLFVKLLESKDETVVSTAAMALNDLGEKGRAALPGLLAALETFPEQSSVLDVVKKDVFAADAVPHMIKWLKGSDPKLQVVAAKLMNAPKLRTAGEAAIPVLLEVIESGAGDEVKIEAMGAIASFGVVADERARPVLQRVVDQGGELGKYAARNIKRLDSAQVMKRIADEEAAKGR